MSEAPLSENKAIYVGLGVLAFVGMVVTTVLVYKANQLDDLMANQEKVADEVEEVKGVKEASSSAETE